MYVIYDLGICSILMRYDPRTMGSRPEGQQVSPVMLGLGNFGMFHVDLIGAQYFTILVPVRTGLILKICNENAGEFFEISV